MVGFAAKIIGLKLQAPATCLMDERPLDLAVLRTFSPLDGLKAENLHALARKTHIRELGAGRVLFKEGDTDKRTFYLVAGNVELRTDDRLIGTIRAGTPEARAALAPGLPRKFTARAAVDLEYIVIDSDLLDVLLTWDQTGQYEVAELRGDGLDVTGDWMTTLLQRRRSTASPRRTFKPSSCGCSASTTVRATSSSNRAPRAITSTWWSPASAW